MGPCGKWPSSPARTRADAGAAAVEFALVFPLVIALVFGVVEAGSVLEQRQGVREDAQLLARRASINFAEADIDDPGALVVAACTELDLPDDATVTISLPEGTGVGGRVEATVTRPLSQMTGFFGALLGGRELTATSDSELQQEAAFSDLAQTCAGTPVSPEPTPTPAVTPSATPLPTPTDVPAATPTPTATPVPTAMPTPIATCTVPDFDDVRKNSATSLWEGAGFSGAVDFLPGSGNYKIHSQSLDDGWSVACDSSITVGP